MSRHGFGRRRTVLQLGEDQTKREAYGFGYRPAPDRSREVNPIGGLDLMMNYEDSGEEEEEEIEEHPNHRKPTRSVQHFVASSERLEPSVVSREPATSSQVAIVPNGRPVSPDTTKPKDEIDSKVLDFLAELDAIDGPDTTSGDGGEGAGLDGEPLPPTPPQLQAETHSDTDSSDGAGAEPKTDWQQCLDDGTQCYYYWNLASNEVTWEIPSEYSQYLLQYKEYEDQLAKHDKETVSRPPERRSKHKKKKKEKEMKQPQVPDEEATFGPELPQSSTPSRPVQGPFLPPLPPVLEKPLPPLEPPPQALELPQSSQQDQETVDPFLIGPQLLPPPPPPDEELEVEPPVLGPELPSSSSTEPVVPNDGEDESSSLGEDMDDDEYIHRKLEEPVYSHYEYVNKKYDGPQPSEESKLGAISSVVNYEDDTDEEDDLDIDDIDRELERALERKQAELQSMEVNSNMKRKAPVDDPVIEARPSHKKLKTNGQEHSTTYIKEATPTQVLKEDVKRKVESLAKVVELTELVSDKLEFLDITRTDLSKLQILLVQVQTRIEDWKDGGLHTEHFVSKLQEAARQLEQYESSAAPPNWSCHWDRKFKRYFYCNDMTDDTQWDYPIEVTANCVAQSEAMPPPPDSQPTIQATNGTTEVFSNSIKTLAVEGKGQTEATSVPHHAYLPGARLSDQHFTDAPTVSSETKDYQTVPDDGPVPVSCPFGADLGHLLTAPPPPPPPPSDPSPPHPIDPGPFPGGNIIGPLPLPSCSEQPDVYQQQVKSPDSDVDGVAINGSPFEDKASLADTASLSQVHQLQKVAECPEAEQTICGKPAHISAAPVIMRTIGNMEDWPGIAEAGTEPAREVTETAQLQETQCLALSPAPPPAHSEGVPTPEETAPVTASVSAPTVSLKEKKKKKDKSLVGRGISMKKKNVTGLVQKWQKVQKEVESEIAKQHKEAVLLEKELEAIGNS